MALGCWYDFLLFAQKNFTQNIRKIGFNEPFLNFQKNLNEELSLGICEWLLGLQIPREIILYFQKVFTKRSDE